MRILFVDDEPKWVLLFNDALKDWNEGHPQKRFTATILDTALDASAALHDMRFDCALLDLKFKNGRGEGHELSGNELALDGLNEFGIPVGILSGNPEDRADELQNNDLVRAFVKRGGACDEALVWFGGLWEMMEALSTTRKRIRRSGAEIFAQRIWPRWQGYQRIGSVDLPVSDIVTRQYASHIAELMGIDGHNNPDWHPLEAYIHPALLDHRAHTGDIFNLNGVLWVIMTPQCDMANRSVEHVLFAHCDPTMVEGWTDKLKRLTETLATADGPPNNLMSWFRDRVNQKIDVSVHFLPPLVNNEPMMVNFKRLQLVPLADLSEMLGTARVASISPSFLPNLTHRFAAYLARPGQPNIGVRHFADAPGGPPI